jgi:hypothetical protein
LIFVSKSFFYEICLTSIYFYKYCTNRISNYKRNDAKYKEQKSPSFS